MDKRYFVYIITNKKEGTLYIGVTSTLRERVEKHKIGVDGSFSKKYNLDKLVFFEEYLHIEEAIKREKQLKRFKRQWKIDLIQSKNPAWNDLFPHVA